MSILLKSKKEKRKDVIELNNKTKIGLISIALSFLVIAGFFYYSSLQKEENEVIVFETSQPVDNTIEPDDIIGIWEIDQVEASSGTIIEVQEKDGRLFGRVISLEKNEGEFGIKLNDLKWKNFSFVGNKVYFQDLWVSDGKQVKAYKDSYLIFKNAKVSAEVYNNDNDQLEYRLKKLSNDSLEELLKKKKENQQKAVHEGVLDKENMEVSEDRVPWEIKERKKTQNNSEGNVKENQNNVWGK
jgi:hypothetical protein